MTSMPTVTFKGRTYKVRSRKTEIPDLAAMDDMAVRVWLLRNTYSQGTNHRGSQPNLAGLAVRVR